MDRGQRAADRTKYLREGLPGGTVLAGVSVLFGIAPVHAVQYSHLVPGRPGRTDDHGVDIEDSLFRRVEKPVYEQVIRCQVREVVKTPASLLR
jgi:hypothetical protein